jgi:cardiolipin synthase (CMP-forming)
VNCQPLTVYLVDIWTIPNAISLLRLLAVPYFWYVLAGQRNVAWAAWLILIIGASDWIDGFLARRLNQVSQVGKFLDPLADRVMIATALIGGLIYDVIPVVIGWALIARELLVGLGVLVLIARRVGSIEVRYLGKLATFLLYGAIPAFYLQSAGVLPELFGPVGWITGGPGLVLYWWVGGQYLGDVLRRLRSVESPG